MAFTLVFSLCPTDPLPRGADESELTATGWARLGEETGALADLRLDEVEMLWVDPRGNWDSFSTIYQRVEHTLRLSDRADSDAASGASDGAEAPT